jgi:DNA-binding transcriptional MocR family regulator
MSPSALVNDAGDTGMNAPPEGFGGTLATAFRDCASLLLGPEMTTLPFQYQRSGERLQRARQGPNCWRHGAYLFRDTVLVAAGGQNALHAIFSAEFKPGDTLAVCASYPGLLALARRFDVKLLPIASDTDGMVPDALSKVCTDDTVSCILSTNDNPTRPPCRSAAGGNCRGCCKTPSSADRG